MDRDNNTPDGAVLRVLVARAWAAPNMWHGVPGYPRVLRVMPRGGSFGGPDFEIRDAKLAPETRGYRRVPPGDAPARAPQSSVLHEDLSPETFPSDEAAFARAVSGFLDEWPRTPRVRWSGLPSALADWYMSMFGSSELRLWQRILVSMAGSATFFLSLMWFLVTASPEWYEYLARSPEGGPLILSSWAIHFILICLIFVFAFLCSWKTRIRGPIRLYLVSFLLPYIVWALVMRIDVRRDLDVHVTRNTPTEAATESDR